MFLNDLFHGHINAQCVFMHLQKSTGQQQQIATSGGQKQTQGSWKNKARGAHIAVMAIFSQHNQKRSTVFGAHVMTSQKQQHGLNGRPKQHGQSSKSNTWQPQQSQLVEEKR